MVFRSINGGRRFESVGGGCSMFRFIPFGHVMLCYAMAGMVMMIVMAIVVGL